MKIKQKNYVKTWVMGILGMIFMVYLWTHLGHPKISFVITSLGIFENIGVAVFFLLPLLNAILDMTTKGLRYKNGYLSGIYEIFGGVILYSMGVWFITNFGDATERYILTRPYQVDVGTPIVVVLLTLAAIKYIFTIMAIHPDKSQNKEND